MIEKLERLAGRHREVERLLVDPAVLGDRARYQELAREHARLSGVVSLYGEYRALLDALEETEKILGEGGDEDFLDLAREEKASLDKRRADLEGRIMLALLPPDPADGKNAIVEIRAGTGGEEAALFASDLFRMYSRFGEREGLKIETLNTHPTGMGGVKEITFLVEGRGAFGKLKYERGVHRVQRIPVTESAGRIHTSAVSVAVLPEAEEVEVRVDPAELRVDVFRSSGPGGQSVNTTDSAVRITHVPTGTVVTCQDEKSQHKNKAKALKVLRSRLLEFAKEEAAEKASRDRRAQIGSGDRSEKVRTYNFPQNRVTDHRIGLSLHRLSGILDGDLEEMISALARSDAEKRALAEERPVGRR